MKLMISKLFLIEKKPFRQNGAIQRLGNPRSKGKTILQPRDGVLILLSQGFSPHRLLGKKCRCKPTSFWASIFLSVGEIRKARAV